MTYVGHVAQFVKDREMGDLGERKVRHAEVFASAHTDGMITEKELETLFSESEIKELRELVRKNLVYTTITTVHLMDLKIPGG